MKILLIYPTVTIKGKDFSGVSPIPPLGLAYIAAYLEKHKHEVKIIDCLAEGFENRQYTKNSVKIGLSIEEIKKRIREFQPNMVGIASMFTSYACDAHEIAKASKQIFPNVPVIFGGSHASAMPEIVLKDKNVDLCIIGEGELTFAEIAEKISKNQPIDNIEGTVRRYYPHEQSTNIKSINSILFNPQRELIKNLDDLPFPARHLLPMDIYLKKHHNPYVMRNPHTFVLTSRGCPFKCTYCSIHSVWKNTWRMRSAKSICDELEFLAKKYKIKEIHFVDDNISVNKQRMHNLCDEIIERKIDIKWTAPNGIAIWTLDKKLLKKMKKSGCYRLTFGIESGSPQTQKFITKNLDLDKARDLMNIAANLGFWIFSTFIIGFPYEDKKNIDMTIDYAINSKSDFVSFYLLMPFPKTKVWDILIRENFLSKKEFFKDTGYILSTRGCNTKYFKYQELQKIVTDAHKRLIKSRIKRALINPIHYLKKIKSFEDLKYAFKIANTFLNLIKFNLTCEGSKVGSSIMHHDKRKKIKLNS